MASSHGPASSLQDAPSSFPSSNVRFTSSFAGVSGLASHRSHGPVVGPLYPFIGDRVLSSAPVTTAVTSVVSSIAMTDRLVHRVHPLPSASPHRASDYARMFLYLPFPELVRSVQRLLDGSVPELLGPHLHAGAFGSDFLDETFVISHRNFHFASYFYCSQLFSLYNESTMTLANIV